MTWCELSARGCRHKDGGHFRHFLDSPEQGLLTLLLWSDMLPKSGGTFCALDSVGVVARFLADHPEGVHADSVQGPNPFRPVLPVPAVRAARLHAVFLTLRAQRAGRRQGAAT